MRKHREHTVAQIRKRFWYDQETGELWRIELAGSVHTDQDGYRSRNVHIDGVQYPTSHVIWAWMTGKWPKRTIDHKDLNGLNDRWSNLREANDSQQKQNNRRRKDSETGFKCVVRCSEADSRGGRYYRWQVVVKGKRIKSGQRFATAEEAYADYQAHLPDWHGEFANDGSTE